MLLRNEQQLGHRWVRLKLAGTRSNRDAIGTWIKARIGTQTLWRQVMPTRSYLSQSELPVAIGWDATMRLDALDVIWPGGQSQSVPVPEPGRTVRIEQAR